MKAKILRAAIQKLSEVEALLSYEGEEALSLELRQTLARLLSIRSQVILKDQLDKKEEN